MKNRMTAASRILFGLTSVLVWGFFAPDANAQSFISVAPNSRCLNGTTAPPYTAFHWECITPGYIDDGNFTSYRANAVVYGTCSTYVVISGNWSWNAFQMEADADAATGSTSVSAYHVRYPNGDSFGSGSDLVPC